MASSSAAGRTFASPLARRLARERDVDLGVLTGSGPDGRVIARDLDATPVAAEPSRREPSAHAAAKEAAKVETDPILALYEPGSYDLIPHDKMRRIIAERLTKATQTIPHFYLSLDCRMDELLAARARINEASPREGEPGAYKLSINDFFIKALALALKRVPAANASWTEAGMLRHKTSDVGVAVAVEGGLFTPIMKRADHKSLSEISAEMRDFAARARKRRLAPHEYQGGSTSISNLGMYGIREFGAVINPPHATILAAGATERRAVVANGQVAAAAVMSCTLSCDHRVVDGALGAELLTAFKDFIEDPVRMIA